MNGRVGHAHAKLVSQLHFPTMTRMCGPQRTNRHLLEGATEQIVFVRAPDPDLFLPLRSRPEWLSRYRNRHGGSERHPRRGTRAGTDFQGIPQGSQRPNHWAMRQARKSRWAHLVALVAVLLLMTVVDERGVSALWLVLHPHGQALPLKSAILSTFCLLLHFLQVKL